VICQTKTAWGCKRGPAKQSRINRTSKEQGLISSCGQVDAVLPMLAM